MKSRKRRPCPHFYDVCEKCVREGERRGLLRAARWAIKGSWSTNPQAKWISEWCRAKAKKLKEALK